MPEPDPQPFATPEQLDRWLAEHHQTHTELWVLLYKKGTGKASVTWDDLVVACLTWGWIDGKSKSIDAISYMQRLTPRRPKSGWSQRNCEIAERLIEQGKMQPAGLAQVEAARKDGRWDQAYAGPASMVLPGDFLEELGKHPAAQRFFETLSRQNLYAIYLRLQTARRAETRQKRLQDIIERLERGEAFH